MNAARKAKLQRHLGRAFERLHAEPPRRVSRALILVGATLFLAYFGLVVEAARSTADAPGLLVRR